MSHYTEISVEYEDFDMLKAAMIAAGIPADHIEVHREPTTLFDYRNRATQNKANVIIRREHVANGAFGMNDIGFTKDKAHICDWARDRQGYDARWLGKIMQEYTYLKTKTHYARQGKQVHRVNEAGKMHLYVRAG